MMQAKCATSWRALAPILFKGMRYCNLMRFFLSKPRIMRNRTHKTETLRSWHRTARNDKGTFAMLRNRLKGRKLSEKTHHYRVQRYDKALRWHQVLLKKFLISEKTRQSESTDQAKRENEDTKRAEMWFFFAWRGFLSLGDKLHYFARITP